MQDENEKLTQALQSLCVWGLQRSEGLQVEWGLFSAEYTRIG